MTIVLLLSPFASSTPDSMGARNDTIAIEVLEERVKGNAESSKDQIESLQKLLDAQNDALNQRISDLDEASYRRTNNILWMAGFFLTFLTALITFFGRRAIAGWIKQSISQRTRKLIKEHKAALVSQGKDATDAYLEELDEQSKARFAKIDKAQEEYERMKDRMEREVKELASAAIERPSAEPGVKTPEFQEKLSAVKVEDEYTARDWFLLGYEADERGESEEAIRCYTESINLDPNRFWSYGNRGNAHLDQGCYDEALMDFDKAIEIDPNNTAGWQNRGITLDKLGLLDKALEAFDKAIEIDHQYAHGHVGRGNTQSKQGLTRAALISFDKALEFAPDDVMVLQNAAEAKTLFGDYDDALLKASKALNLSKTSKDKATSLYLKCIAEKLTGKDTSVTKGELDRILKEDFVTTWSFDMIEKWLETADISDETREFIKAISAKLKAKTKKQ